MNASLRWSACFLGLLLASATACASTDESTEEGTSRPGSTATATPSDLGGIDEVVARVEESLDVYSYSYSYSSTGIVVRVRVGEQARTLVVGLASREPRRRLRAPDTFQVGSVTKTMVATVVLQAVTRGQLALDDIVERWLPDLLELGGGATLEELLSHRSGLPDYIKLVKPGHSYGSASEAVSQVSTSQLDFQPGESGTYSNTNFLVLGMVVEKATGTPLAELLRRDVLEPAGMRHTTLSTYPAPGTPRPAATPTIPTTTCPR